MNKKIHKKITKLEKFLHIDDFKKIDLKKLIKSKPIKFKQRNQLNKFYQDYKKIKEEKTLKEKKKLS